MTRLDRLLRPESVAVVGGSWSRSVIEQLQLMQYQGNIWPVHPTHSTLSGLPCFNSISALPAAPDASFIGVNRHTTLKVIGELSALGGGGAVCFASGFSEASAEDGDAVRLQQELLELAGQMPIVGPNCYGFINYLDGVLLWPDLHGGQRVANGVALITQSSNIAISLTMQRRALPIAYVLTAGNQAQLSMAELGMAALQDPRVTALGMHIEGFGDIRSFEDLAHEAGRLGKGIVAIKVGRSQQSRLAMISHTNSLSGSDASSDALFRRLGIARVNSLPALLESLKLLHVFGRIGGNTIASMSCSGGEAGLMADAIVGRPLHYQALTDAKREALRGALGQMVALANPLDYHTYIWNKLPAMVATFTAMLEDGADLSFLVIDFPRSELQGGESWMVAVEALIEARKRTGSAVAVLASLPENIPDAIAQRLLDEGIPSMYGIEDAMDATAAVATIGQSTLPATLPTRLTLAELPGGNNLNSYTLTEYNSKQVLQQAGLAVPEATLVENYHEANQAAAVMGYPVVLKLTGEAHKTDHDGVVLNISNADELLTATESLFESSKQLLLERYCDGAVAELLVGIVRESSGFLMLTVGAGGVLTEIIRDTRSLLLPTSIEEIEDAVGELKIAAILRGYRNKPAANLLVIAQQIHQLCDWAVQNATNLYEVEVNPLLCLHDEAIVADALIRMRKIHE